MFEEWTEKAAVRFLFPLFFEKQQFFWERVGYKRTTNYVTYTLLFF